MKLGLHPLLGSAAACTLLFLAHKHAELVYTPEGRRRGGNKTIISLVSLQCWPSSHPLFLWGDPYAGQCWSLLWPRWMEPQGSGSSEIALSGLPRGGFNLCTLTSAWAQTKKRAEQRKHHRCLMHTHSCRQTVDVTVQVRWHTPSPWPSSLWWCYWPLWPVLIT